ncbi:MAG: hypothetical protein FJ010_11230 [Chloroflexi bacterium]|nr:hypothetical protein [Chloroflexota bacterium]
MNLGDDDDTVNVGALMPLTGGNVNSIGALLTVKGDAGNDTLYVSDAGDANANVGTLTATMLTGLGMTSGITFDTVETVSVALGNAPVGTQNTFNIQSTASGVTTVVNGGSGDEVFNVGNASNSLDQILGALVLNGYAPAASDALNIND